MLFVGSYVSSAHGSRGVSEDIADRLARDGWEVSLTSRSASRVRRVAEMGIAAWRRRASYDVALIDVYSGAAFGWAELVSRVMSAAGRPFVLTLHGGNLPELARRSPDRLQRLLASAAAVTAPSEYLRAAVSGLRADVRLLPNPLALDTIQFRPRSGLQPRLLWLRAFHAIYNAEMALRVVARLAKEFPDLRLTMIGADKDGSGARAKESAVRLGIADRVLFLGGVPKASVPAHLEAHDIFLNTTNADNMPVSVLEAMAAGLCVVSTAVGGLPFLLEKDIDALLVRPDDDAAMAAAVARLLREPQLASQLALSARRKAEQFDWDQVLPQWKALFIDVARTSRGAWNA